MGPTTVTIAATATPERKINTSNSIHTPVGSPRGINHSFSPSSNSSPKRKITEANRIKEAPTSPTHILFPVLPEDDTNSQNSSIKPPVNSQATSVTPDPADMSTLFSVLESKITEAVTLLRRKQKELNDKKAWMIYAYFAPWVEPWVEPEQKADAIQKAFNELEANQDYDHLLNLRNKLKAPRTSTFWGAPSSYEHVNLSCA